MSEIPTGRSAAQPLFDVLWPEGRQWKSQAEIEEFTGLLMRYWNYIADRVQEDLLESTGSYDEKVNSGIVDIWAEDQKDGEAGGTGEVNVGPPLAGVPRLE